MLKRFFISFLGAIAGFWVSIVIGGIALFVIIVGAVAIGAGSKLEVKEHSILHLKLDGEIVEREEAPNIIKKIYGENSSMIPLNVVVDAIDAAADDDNIEGMFIDCKGSQSGLADRQELNNAIDRFREAGKWVIAYADNFSQGDYFTACHADSVLLNPIGAVDLHGLASVTPFMKGMLDKLGVEMQVVKVGTYKSAVEPFILTDMSEPAREQQKLYLDNIWKEMTGVIAKQRNLTSDAVNALADSILMTKKGDEFVKAKLVDGLRYRHQVLESLCELTDRDKVDDLRFVDATEYGKNPATELKNMKGNKTIAVLYAVGDITDDGDNGISASKIVPEIFKLIDDDDIDALVLRVNSGGGSAFASEQIWEALEQFKELTGKPFYVSMADYAASGGYYISCGADKIYADPLTLTGSIGIFGMIPNVQKGLNEHLGVNMATVQTNPDAAFPSIFKPMTEAEKAAMQRSVNDGYELFTSRVAAGRKMSVDSVKMIAEGRVWDGATALKIGLVDKMGGLDVTLRDVAVELGTDFDKCRIEVYPDNEFKWWEQMLMTSQLKIKSWLMADELSPAAREIYDAIGSLSRMNPVQARMLPVEIK